MIPASSGSAPVFRANIRYAGIDVSHLERGYFEKVANQVNGCYERRWFDACAVMVRRLIETLIIELEHHGIAATMKNANGDFLYLRDLVNATLAESRWNLGRNVKSALRCTTEMRVRLNGIVRICDRVVCVADGLLARVHRISIAASPPGSSRWTTRPTYRTTAARQPLATTTAETAWVGPPLGIAHNGASSNEVSLVLGSPIAY